MCSLVFQNSAYHFTSQCIISVTQRDFRRIDEIGVTFVNKFQGL